MIRVCSGNNAATAATKLSMRGDQVRRVSPLDCRRGLKLESQRADSVSEPSAEDACKICDAIEYLADDLPSKRWLFFYSKTYYAYLGPW